MGAGRSDVLGIDFGTLLDDVNERHPVAAAQTVIRLELLENFASFYGSVVIAATFCNIEQLARGMAGLVFNSI